MFLSSAPLLLVSCFFFISFPMISFLSFLFFSSQLHLLFFSAFIPSESHSPADPWKSLHRNHRAEAENREAPVSFPFHPHISFIVIHYTSRHIHILVLDSCDEWNFFYCQFRVLSISMSPSSCLLVLSLYICHPESLLFLLEPIWSHYNTSHHITSHHFTSSQKGEAGNTQAATSWQS